MTDIENEELWKEYFYPNTNVFINNYNIMDDELLKEKEATISFEKLLELRENPINKDSEKEELNAIHKYVFGELYPWAGEYRKVNMLKSRGTFLHINTSEDIDHYLDRLFQDANNALETTHSKFEFCEVLAKLYTGLIYCHPYREGNGRSVREFIREYSIKKSKELNLGTLELDWSKIDREELHKFIEVSHYFPGQTALLFLGALEPVEIKSK